MSKKRSKPKETDATQNEIALLRNAVTELGFALSKADLNENARYHMEVFWQLLENKKSATRN